MPQVKIEMTPETVRLLLASRNYLYALRAVKSSDRAGRPLVWRQIRDYSTATFVSWQDLYRAYTSSSPIVAETTINVGFSASITPEQTLSVEAGGVGSVVAGGPAEKISILNTVDTQFTCGLSENSSEGGSDGFPYCAFPLYGSNLQQIGPLEKVLLTFATESLPPGTVIGSVLGSRLSEYTLASFTSSVLIDLTGATERDVSYDINLGWSWGEAPWARSIPAGANLVPWLIEAGVAGRRALR
jgi:hypothetical protein